MKSTVELYDLVAKLLKYPGDRSTEELACDALAVGAEVPSAQEALASFAEFARSSPPHELEELYTRTFDHNPERALEVGWHAFGETYARGAFLVGMRERLRTVQVPECGELPDHLVHVLQVLGRLPKKTAAALADGVLKNAVEKMLAGFDDAQHPYRAPLLAALALIRSECEPEHAIVTPKVHHE